VEENKAQSVGAVLGTVKVVCAVERGLEALLGALELGKKKGEVNGDLMQACLANPDAIALEMQRTIVCMRRVLKTKKEMS
jgi:hypothetical protein